MKLRTSLAAAVALGLLAAGAAEAKPLRVMGQPVATGLIQKNVEQPFFENFKARTGLDMEVNYQPVDVTGIKDTEQLRILKSGLFDIVSLRLSQVSRDEPTILGMDLVGLNPDYATGKKTVGVFAPIVDARLQEKFNTKLLGVWPFGPQVLFCKPEIAKLADLSGKKVRVYDQNLANFVSLVGGTPVPLSFPDVQQSLARGVVDCALTGTLSGNTAGWPEVTTHLFPLPVGWSIYYTAVNLDSWNRFPPAAQDFFTKEFAKLEDANWDIGGQATREGVQCNIGEDPCTLGKKSDLKLVPLSDADKKKREAVEAKNQGESLIHSTEKSMSEYGDKVSADEKAAIETAIADLKAVIDGDDGEAIKEKTDALGQASMKLGEAMYKASQAEAEAKANGTDDDSDDDVVDADFEEVSDDDDKKSA